MVESLTLRLMFALDGAHDRLLGRLCASLAARGYDVSPSGLGFLGQLDCGVNRASDIARRLGVSRQMVHKTVREMERLGYLRQEDDPDRRNSKRIVFTDDGIALMADARRDLQRWDAELTRMLGDDRLSALLRDLDRIAANTPDAGASGAGP